VKIPALFILKRDGPRHYVAFYYPRVEGKKYQDLPCRRGDRGYQREQRRQEGSSSPTDERRGKDMRKEKDRRSRRAACELLTAQVVAGRSEKFAIVT
jgi:hypothetical protein